MNKDTPFQTVQDKFPTTIAVLFKKMLDESHWEVKTREAINIYEVWMRSITLQLLVQYLEHDIHNLPAESVQKLNKALSEGILKPLLGTIVSIFFHLLTAYRYHEDWLFMPELHGILYKPGGRSKVPKASEAFYALVTIRNELAHGRGKPVHEPEWRNKYEEVLRYLTSVFDKFTFVSNYRFLHRLKDGTVQQFKGLEPELIEPGSVEVDTLLVGRLYLDDCRKPGQFYQLHPLFLPWPSDIFEWKQGQVNSDDEILPAYFDSYINRKIHYAVATAWVEKLVLTDEDVSEKVLQLLEGKLEDFRSERREVDSLEWEVFKEISTEITAIETETIKDKFSSDLYLQRKHIKRAFEHFLDSEKIAFVLLGKSGVGKSNFVFSMQETYKESKDSCMLIFDSTRLTVESDLTAVLKELFSKKLQLRENGLERKFDDILVEINKIREIGNKKVILAFDAINENPEPHKLLRLIDRLISNNSSYPWLKVVLTSRPEAWQNMKQRYRLAESLYYRQPDTQDLEVELRGFDVEAAGAEDWVAMDRFKPVELPEVYALYRKKYHLQSVFDNLSPEMKVMLRDPLALRLVAETYGSTTEKKIKGGILPQSIRISKLYEQYINSLIDDGRLERNDISDFLEKKILPLMFQSGEYRNSLGVEILTHTICETSGKPLAEEVELTDIISSTGRRVNQSFQNLVDADILVKQGSYSEYEINFKYERFYDHFGGNYFYENNQLKSNKQDVYKDLINKINIYPFLWGSIRNAIFNELVTGNHKLIISLASEENQSTRELIISVLTELGREPDGKHAVEIILQPLLKIDRRSTSITNWFRVKLTGTDNSNLSIAARSASKTALEVARRLGFLTILEMAAFDSSSLVRITAVRNIYYFWREYPDEGYALLERIVNKVTRRGILPNIPALESAIALSLLLMRHYYPNTLEGRMLGMSILGQMRSISRHIFFVSDKGSMLGKFIAPIIRNFVVNAVIQFIVKTQEAYPEDKPSFLNEVSDLLNATSDVKARYDRLVNYFKNPCGLENIRKDLDQSVAYNDTLTNGLIWLIVMLDFINERETDLSILEELADLELTQPQVGSTNEGMIVALGLISLYNNQIGHQNYRQLERMIEKYVQRTRGLYFARNGTEHPCLPLSHQITLRCLRQNHQDHDLPKVYLKKAIQEEDWRFFSMILDELATQVSTSNDFLHARFALESMKVAYPLPIEKKAESKFLFTLARIRLYQPEEVDNFLMEINPKNEILPKVLRIEPDENVWSELFHNIYSTILIRLLQTQEIKDELIWILDQATIQKNLRGYLKITVKDVMNLLTGEQIFKINK